MFMIHSRTDSLGCEQSGGSGEASSDSSTRTEGGRFGCEAGLECLLGIVRALRLASFLSLDELSSCSSVISSSPEKRPPNGPRRKRGSSSREEQLHGIPGRMFLNGASEVASLFTQQGRKGINQDAMIVWEGDEFVIANVGDSRAVLGTRDKNNSLIAVQLTVDLKPNLRGEAERIRKCRGRVFALREEPDVTRVWLPHKDMPGLAMARALGDFVLKDYGLSSVPEISYRHTTESDEFVVLATDGVWDVLTNQEVVDIVASAPDRSSAAHFLVESAVKAWRVKYPTSRIDDCAVVCLFFDADAPTTSYDHMPNTVQFLSSTTADYDEEKAFKSKFS